MEGFLLNEQTWLQHLKEKRLAYGLSQNRLAVATGITRQYLSDIETGKVKPSEDLQQSLWEALERFNPDAPLEMLFDYVRIRFPTTDVQQVVENILQLGFLIIAIIAVGLVFNAAGVKDILLELFNRIIGA